MNEDQARIFAEILEQTKRYYAIADPLTLKPGHPSAANKSSGT